MSLPTREIGGYKATLNNPKVSDEAKEHARHAINELEQDPETQQVRESDEDYKATNHKNAGFKATLKNPNVGEEAKERAEHALQALAEGL